MPRRIMSEGWTKRQAIWRHNSFRGHAKMMQAQCRAIMDSKTTTADAKASAKQIYHLAVNMGLELQTRRDSE